MAEQPVHLSAFGSPTFFRDAYRFFGAQGNRNQRLAIYDWLDRASRGETGGPPTLDPEVRARLTQALEYLRSLSIGGALYMNPTPQEHFYRREDEDWTKDEPKKGSKFRLMERCFQRQDVHGKTIDVGYWSPYDLLGYFLSKLGPAPAHANRNNYFLPLTAVYARWSSKIAGRYSGGAGDWPFMFQCTWYRESGYDEAHFGLGASLAGSGWDSSRVGEDWRTRVGFSRFLLLSIDTPAIVNLERSDWDNNTAPEQTRPGGSQTRWANCAETYPFTEQMRDEETRNWLSLDGIALQRDFLSEQDDEYDGYRDGKIWSNVCGPCYNCRELLTRVGVKLYVQFDNSLEKNMAPKAPVQPDPLKVAASNCQCR